MQRVQAILVMVALLATPLALLARTTSPSADCDMMCCPANHSRSTPMPMQNSMHHEANLANHCLYHAADMDMTCCMESGRSALPYGLLAMMAPTNPSAHARLAPPAVSLRSFVTLDPFAPQGSSADLFEPPRR